MSSKANSNLFAVFLDALDVRYTRSFARKLYARHPHKYNMYGLSKMLTDYHIPNQGIKFDDPADVATIEPPFVAQFAGDLYVVKKITDSEVHLFKSGMKTKVPVEKFKEGCTGAVLVAEPDEDSTEPGLKENRRKELFGTVMRHGLVVALCAVVIYACFVFKTYTDPGLLVALLINLEGCT